MPLVNVNGVMDWPVTQSDCVISLPPHWPPQSRATGLSSDALWVILYVYNYVYDHVRS